MMSLPCSQFRLMPASTSPQTWPWPAPHHPLVRAPGPLLITHCPSPNHLVGDRVNTGTSYHHQRVAFQSSGDVTAPCLIPVTWIPTQSSTPLAWAKLSTETPVGWANSCRPPWGFHVLCWPGPGAGTSGGPWPLPVPSVGAGWCSASSQDGKEAAFSPSCPSHTLGSL